MDSIGRISTISINAECYYRVVYDNFVFQQDSALVHLALHSTQSNCCSAKLSISTVHSLVPLTMRFRVMQQH